LVLSFSWAFLMNKLLPIDFPMAMQYVMTARENDLKMMIAR
jgi:hypothetical protein